MGSELVDDLPTPLDEGGIFTALSFTQIFYKHLPYYLSIGMTSDEFWLKDVFLAKAYREADEIRKDRRNEELWLQGAYIYDALTRVAPLLSLGGGTSEGYIEEPYPRTQKQYEEQQERKNKRATEQTLDLLKSWQSNVNKGKGED